MTRGAPGSPISTRPPRAAGVRLGGAGAATDGGAARDGMTTTLRLVSAGRVAAVVRSDAATVQVDAVPSSAGERWQATLSPARRAPAHDARRLPP